MKKTFKLLLLLLLSFFATRAQLSTYSFTHGIETFQSIESNPDLKITVPVWNHGYTSFFSPAFPLNGIKAFGHPRNYLNAEYTERTGLHWETSYNNATGQFTMTAGNLSFNTFEGGWVGWDTVVNQSNHDTLLIYEFHNVILDSVKSPAGISKFTFQIHIHTLDNSIEFRYGPADIASGSILSDLLIVGLFYQHSGGFGGQSADFSLTLKGNPVSPVLSDEREGLNGWPAPNTVYRFIPAALPPNPTKINEESLLAQKVTLYPIPATNSVNVNLNGLRPEKAVIVNAVGQQVKEIAISNNQIMNINTSDFATGAYFIKIQFPQETIHKQFIVSH